MFGLCYYTVHVTAFCLGGGAFFPVTVYVMYKRIVIDDQIITIYLIKILQHLEFKNRVFDQHVAAYCTIWCTSGHSRYMIVD